MSGESPLVYLSCGMSLLAAEAVDGAASAATEGIFHQCAALHQIAPPARRLQVLSCLVLITPLPTTFP